MFDTYQFFEEYHIYLLMNNEKAPYVCPSEFAGSLDNSFRKWLHNPQKILKPYIQKGMTVLDLGCGPGVFTVEIAKMLQDSGKVIAADLQEGMLEIIAHKIKGTDLEKRVELHKCQADSIGISEKADFVLAFWMVHEVPDHDSLFKELKSILKPDGKIFIIEPRMHVTAKTFKVMTDKTIKAGFEIIGRPKVFFSRTLLLEHIV
jgi:ubiquinone/menaquinone biosynthesis C-methylase UbiE